MKNKSLKEILNPEYISEIKEKNLENNLISVLSSIYTDFNEIKILEFLTWHLDYTLVDIEKIKRFKPLFDEIPYNHVIESKIIAIKGEEEIILVVVDPFQGDNINFYQNKLRLINNNITKKLITLEEFNDLIKFYSQKYDVLDTMNIATEQYLYDVKVEDISLASLHLENREIIKLVNSFIFEAIKKSASDIHVETHGDELYILYRIDGSLIEMKKYQSNKYSEKIISRIKVIANLDISENRIPQDGRIKLSIDERSIDFRVSIMPSIYGEDAVLRILDNKRISNRENLINLESLGFIEKFNCLLRKVLLKENGMVLITGPTGSGKTSTLYAIINEIKSDLEKIITIEDPVEYNLERILQIPVNEKKGLTFAKGLRSILRHDPDKIMVGEIRDSETALIAIQAALTGHLVFTTVHANSVFDVINRFKYMGIDTYSFVSALNVVVSQRLVKKLCEHCSILDSLAKKLISEEFDFDSKIIAKWCVKKPVGCEKCYNTGYSGRLPITEILIIDEIISEKLIEGVSIAAIKKYAIEKEKLLLKEEQLFNFLSRGQISLAQVMSQVG